MKKGLILLLTPLLFLTTETSAAENECDQIGGNTLLISATYNEADGTPGCAAAVTFCAKALANFVSYSWSISGPGYFSSGTSSDCATVVSIRNYQTSSSYTVYVQAVDDQGTTWNGDRIWQVQAGETCD